MTAVLALEELLAELRRKHLAPPPKLTVSEWADRYRIVSSYSAEPGPWRTDRTPYLREIMDSLGDPLVQMVVFQKCARIGGSEAGLNIVGYFIDQDPSPIMIVQPTVDDAKDFSKEQLAPMLADTPCLTDKVKEPRAKDSGNTVQAKQFPGGALFLVGANSPRGFRRRTVRLLDLEEVDGYPLSAGTEGDQISLAIRRTATFAYRRKIYMNSSPTLKGPPSEGGSRIEDYYLKGDQRRYHVPCPHCAHAQVLLWANLRFQRERDLESLAYFCTGCGAAIEEREKFAMIRRGRWIPARPGRPVRSYHINALYSPWVTWAELMAEWLDAQGDVLKLQTFVNTVLGETWEDRAGGLDPTILSDRRRDYGAEVPDAVSHLTTGVDVHDDRLEVTVWGWGPGEAMYRITHLILAGDPGKRGGVWDDLDRLRAREWQRADGSTVRIYATAVDTGHHAQAVCDYVRPRYGQRVYAVRGASLPGKPIAPRAPSRNNKHRCPVFFVGTDAAKDVIYSRLRRTEEGPGFVMFDLATDAVFLDQLTSEQKKPVRTAGRIVRRYVLPKGKSSPHALDCAVYALAALYIAGVDRNRLGRGPTPPPTPVPARAPDPVPLPQSPTPARLNFGVQAALDRARRKIRR